MSGGDRRAAACGYAPAGCPGTTRDGAGDPDNASADAPERRALEPLRGRGRTPWHDRAGGSARSGGASALAKLRLVSDGTWRPRAAGRGQINSLLAGCDNDHAHASFASSSPLGSDVSLRLGSLAVV